METYCKICEKDFKTNWGLKRHLSSSKHFKKTHPENFVECYDCNRCGKSFDTKQQLDIHKSDCVVLRLAEPTKLLTKLLNEKDQKYNMLINAYNDLKLQNGRLMEEIQKENSVQNIIVNNGSIIREQDNYVDDDNYSNILPFTITEPEDFYSNFLNELQYCSDDNIFCIHDTLFNINKKINDLFTSYILKIKYENMCIFTYKKYLKPHQNYYIYCDGEWSKITKKKLRHKIVNIFILMLNKYFSEWEQKNVGYDYAMISKFENYYEILSNLQINIDDDNIFRMIYKSSGDIYKQKN